MTDLNRGELLRTLEGSLLAVQMGAQSGEEALTDLIERITEGDFDAAPRSKRVPGPTTTGVRWQDRHTSLEAARQAERSATTIRGHVYAVIEQHGPITDERLTTLVRQQHTCADSSPRKRRVELCEDGLVRASDETGRTQAGAESIKWEVVQ